MKLPGANDKGALYYGLVVCTLPFSVIASKIRYAQCNCDSNSFWNHEIIFQCQKLGDFLIAAAYFSISVELLCFLACSKLLPFKWIVFQFGAFIVLCGLTHLLNVFVYQPHSFLLMLSLTISKFFTALVSIATSITLLTLIPQLLRVKVRENFLRLKAQELDREVGIMKRQEETSWHVRMLTQEIRKSLDRHTILRTTLVELSNTLGLQNCAVWMLNKGAREMNLTHQLRERSSFEMCSHSIPIDDPDVRKIQETKGVEILGENSALGSLSGGEMLQPGAVAAVRMALLMVSHFEGGTPEMVEATYAILVSVLPRDESRCWSRQELDIVEVVADQVAVALSHAAVLEESQLLREKLEEQNRDLLLAKKNTLTASKARNKFQLIMSQEIRRPIHSILGMLSMMQQEKMNPQQRLIIDAVAKSSSVVSKLINDAIETTTVNSDRLSLAIRPFRLHSLIKEAISTARCLCDSRGFDLEFQVGKALPDQVFGDETRIFHVILHMIGTLLNGHDEGFLVFQILKHGEDNGELVQEWFPWKSNFSRGYTYVTFSIATRSRNSNSTSLLSQYYQRSSSVELKSSLSFRMCKRIVHRMQGNIRAVSNPQGIVETLTLTLQFQLCQLRTVSDARESLELRSAPATPNFEGLRVLLVDNDDINRAVTQKLLEKLGCHVSSVASGSQCLNHFNTYGNIFQLLVVDLNMPRMDGFYLAARIRESSGGPWPVILALTACDDGQVQERCFRSGMNGLIHKPVTLQAMADELHNVLQDI